MSARLAARLPFYYGWLVVAVAFVTMAVGVNARTAFSLLYPPILAETGWDRGATAATFSVGFLASALYAPLVGLLMDRFGPRYVMGAAALVVSAGLIACTRVESAWQLYLTLGVMVVGGSVSLSYMGHGAFLPDWFVRRRGLALGIAFGGVGAGSIVLFPWLQHVIDGSGWRSACWALAGVLLVVVLPLNFALQRRRPGDLDLEPDGDARPAPGDAARRPDNIVDPVWAGTDWTLRRALATARFWWLFVGVMTGLFGWYAVQVHQTRYLLDAGFDGSAAALALGAVPLLGLLGQISVGHLSDRIGREWAWTCACLGFVACFAALLALPGSEYATVLLVVVVASQGLLGYGMSICYSAMPAELFAGRHYGAIFGTYSISAAIGPAAGPWLTGVLYDRYGAYDQALVLCMVLALVSIVCIWLAAPRKVRAVAGRVARLRQERAPHGRA